MSKLKDLRQRWHALSLRRRRVAVGAGVLALAVGFVVSARVTSRPDFGGDRLVAVGGGQEWVSDADTLQRIDAFSGTPVGPALFRSEEFGVAAPPTALEFCGGTVWQGDHLGGLISVPTDVGQLRGVDLPPGGESIGTVIGLACGSDALWALVEDDDLSSSSLVLEQPSRLVRVRLPAGPAQTVAQVGRNSVALDVEGGRVWVLHEQGLESGASAVLKRRDSVGRLTGRLALEWDFPLAVKADAHGRLWVLADRDSEHETGGVVLIDAATLKVVRTIAVGPDPRGLAVDEAGTAWVTDGREQVVRVVSPGGSMKTIPARPKPSGIAIGPDAVYVALAKRDLLRIRKHALP